MNAELLQQPSPCLCGCPCHLHETCGCGCVRYAPDYLAALMAAGVLLEESARRELAEQQAEVALSLGAVARAHEEREHVD